MGDMADYYYELGLMEEAIDHTVEDAQEKVIRELFHRIGGIFNNPARDDRMKFKTYQSSMLAWTRSAQPETSLHWREGIRNMIWEKAKGLSPEGFRNMNNVNFVHWPKMYAQRVEAIRSVFFAWARQLDIEGLGKVFKTAREPSPIPPGTYTVQLDKLVGKRAEFVILDDIAEGQTISWDLESWGAVTGRWSSTDVENEQMAKEAAKMFKNVKTVRVRFDGTSKLYEYFTNDSTIKENDLVIVDAAGDFKLVRVVDVLEGLGNERAWKWVVQKIDLDAYKARQEKIKAAVEVKKALDSAVERAKELVTYEKIAEGNAEVRELLEKFKNLEL